jgi:predicted RNase H-like nuclease (RuvC/YqgF family)
MSSHKRRREDKDAEPSTADLDNTLEFFEGQAKMSLADVSNAIRTGERYNADLTLDLVEALLEDVVRLVQHERRTLNCEERIWRLEQERAADKRAIDQLSQQVAHLQAQVRLLMSGL